MILLCFGTRPEWLKIKPLTEVLDNYQLLFTGQHIDLLDNVNIDYTIEIGNDSNRLNQIISSCLLQFPDGDFDSVLVQGDTSSAFACALAAFHKRKKIYYLEAGLRSYDLDHPYPEEAYRQMISRISDVNLCPTKLSNINLTNERTKGKCYVIGNTCLDNLVSHKERCEYSNKVLVTLHRRENHHWMDKWFVELNQLALNNPDLEFILPIHPNPSVQKHKNLLTNVNVIEPLSHPDLLDILVKSRLIITDSGGIQEEGSFFNKKVIVCRETTERPEGIGTGHLYLCNSPKLLSSLFVKLNNDYRIDSYCPYGDGQSSERLKRILTKNKDVIELTTTSLEKNIFNWNSRQIYRWKNK